MDQSRNRLVGLYEPLDALLRSSGELHAQLKEGKPGGLKWRTVDHMPEVLASTRDKEIVRQIIEIGDRIEALLADKAELAATPADAACFARYRRHLSLMKGQFEGSGATAGPGDSFPRELPDLVAASIASLRASV